MRIGKGFDSDGDGENDFYVSAPVDLRGAGDYLGKLIITAVLMLPILPAVWFFFRLSEGEFTSLYPYLRDIGPFPWWPLVALLAAPWLAWCLALYLKQSGGLLPTEYWISLNYGPWWQRLLWYLGLFVVSVLILWIIPSISMLTRTP